MPGLVSTAPKTAGAAVKTFPVLLKWGLSKRPAVSAYPIGGSWQAQQIKRATVALSSEEKRACARASLPTLYHDLGVIAFDGCTYQQSQRMGEILAKAVALGVKTKGPKLADDGRAVEAFDVFGALWELEEATWGYRVQKED